MKRNIIAAALTLAALCVFSPPASAAIFGFGVGGPYGGYVGGTFGSPFGSGYYAPFGYARNAYAYPGYYGPGSTQVYGSGLGAGILDYSRSGYGYYPGYGYPYPTVRTYVAPTVRYVAPVYPSLATIPAPSSRSSLYYAPEVPDDTAHVRYLGPADAKLWIGGVETSKTGSERDFTTPPLVPGKSYTYEVKARWVESGEPVERTRKVKVEANRTTVIDFDRLAEKK